MAIAQTNTRRINELDTAIESLEDRIDTILYRQTLLEYDLYVLLEAREDDIRHHDTPTKGV